MAFASAVVLPSTPFVAGDIVSLAGALSAADGTNGNRFILNQTTLVRVKNGSASPVTVTVHTNRMVGDLTLPSDTFVVPATTGDVIWKPNQPLDMYWQSGTSEVWIEFSAVTTVTVKIYEA